VIIVIVFQLVCFRVNKKTSTLLRRRDYRGLSQGENLAEGGTLATVWISNN